jgi:ATP adenylyltransferase
MRSCLATIASAIPAGQYTIRFRLSLPVTAANVRPLPRPSHGLAAWEILRLCYHLRMSESGADSQRTGMQRLWAPWRMSYVTGKKQPGCVFCNALTAGDDVTQLILYRGKTAFLILNLYPYNSGHLMAVPYAHVPSTEECAPETRAELFELAHLGVLAARTVLRCHGFNLGMNLGEIAGAGVAEHVHLHVVPRWTGDANFMPILGNTIVMPELLPVTYARLRAEIERLIAVRDLNAMPQAGGLVVIPETGSVVLRRSRKGDIVLPKGHIEEDEAAWEAAVREVREETGITARIAGWAGSNVWQDDAGATRHVSHLLMTAAPPKSLPDEVILAPIDAAARMLDVSALREMVERLVPILTALSPDAR